ncbi:Hypothetical predicted protein [Podarcis lilfordi]|uniref:Uncharacterized protein n=1 Tax=Podarcis lilfordi TaxID=74358 RepID=A0AA35LFN7_9SAUR|nr:Hypothetical predicted protein [Podarcis lilfordi]
MIHHNLHRWTNYRPAIDCMNEAHRPESFAVKESRLIILRSDSSVTGQLTTIKPAFLWTISARQHVNKLLLVMQAQDACQPSPSQRPPDVLNSPTEHRLP